MSLQLILQQLQRIPRTDIEMGLDDFLIIVILVIACHTARSFVLWRTHFGKELRVARSNPKCPSHKQAPLVRRGSSMSLTSERPLPPRRKPSIRRLSSYSSQMADQLDMDHIYLSFRSFLWGMLFIWPATLLAAMRGLIILMIRNRLCGWGLIHPMPFDPAHVCYNFVLHGTLAVHFVGFDHDGNAKYQFDSIPIINKEGGCEVKDLELCLNLKSKRLESAVLDHREVLSAKETLIILFFFLSTAHHVKIHALANWAVIADGSTPASPFVAQNGTTTVMYNYFGYTGFKELFPSFQVLGLISPGLDPGAINSVIHHGLEFGIPEHSNIIKLAKHSPFIDFIVKVRGIFKVEFAKHQDSFPRCDVEALFAGTALHSLDHSSATWNLKDELWLDVNCPKFGRMAEIGRVIRAAFTDDLACLAFHKSFRNSGHPFYEAVYKKAAGVNKLYADQMDTCIIK